MNTSKTIEELHDMLITKKITPQELINEAINKSYEVNKKCNAFVTIIDKPNIIETNENLLSNIPFGAKDNYSTKGILSTGSSNTLKDYVPFFSATAIDNLAKNGAVLINKTALDEFGLGATGTTCHTGIVRNPWNLERMCGGSSSGSVAAVASGVYPFALGTDTGDSIRKPAAFCGVVGYKPTYGMISRYGIFPYASSLDHAGCITRSVKDAAIVVDAMKGQDPKDLTSWDSSKINLYAGIDGNVKGKKLFYIDEIVNKEYYLNAPESVKMHLDNFYSTLDILKSKGVEIEKISLDINLLKAIPGVYHCISFAEATSNLSNLTSISFGKRGKGNTYEEIVKDYRTNGFSPLIKRRLVIGSFILQKENQEKYYVNACRVRRLLVDEMKKLFDKYDGMILPVSSGPAPYFDDDKNEQFDTSLLDNNLQIGNLGGFPSITIPNGFVNNMPVGINITGNCFDDLNVLNIAFALESEMPYKNQIVKEEA